MGRKLNARRARRGFTLIELMIVMVILAIAAAMVVPMASSAGSMQVRAAGNMVAADLEYAKSMAISRGQKYSVVFDTTNDSYRVVIIDQSGNETPVLNPITQNPKYEVKFQSDTRLNQVVITGASFSGTNTTNIVTFDYLGSPYSGGGSSASQLNSGSITLQAGGVTKTVNVEPVTGYISVN